MRMSCVALLAVFVAPAALAQTGPAVAHIVVAAVPNPGSLQKSSDEQPDKIMVRISVGPDGRATAVDLDPPSGDPKFDERIRKLYLQLRVIPALTDAGVPIASKVAASLELHRRGLMSSMNDPWSAQAAAGNQVDSAGISQAQLPDEVARIVRMRCKDFLWEYDLMREIAGRRPLYDERLFKALLAMTLVYVKATGEQVNQVVKNFPEGVRVGTEQCRASPDIAFFQESFAPAIRAALR
jgi:hypothetical protein